MSTDVSPSQPILQLVAQFWVARALLAAANLGIADQIGNEPRAAGEIAAALGLDPECLYRLLRGLAGHGVFHEEEGQRFTHTPASATLRADHPDSVLNIVRIFGFKSTLQGSVGLERAIRTGSPFEDSKSAPNWFEMLDERPEESAIYDTAMAKVTKTFAEAILAAFDFSGIALLADIGGGNGTFLSEILRKNPRPRGILFDLPRAVADAERVFERYGVSARCEARGGDFFVEAPTGCDGYMLKNVLHSWNDEECLKLLGNIRRASKSGARIFVVENLMTGPNLPGFGKVFDLFTLMGGRNGARVRTQAETAALLKRSGFELVRATGDARTGLSFIESRTVITSGLNPPEQCPARS